MATVHSPREARKKPWGTGHAILCCRDQVPGPFAVINADDFYGAEPYAALARHLGSLGASPPGDVDEFCMAGYVLGSTLSEHGSVARGVCAVGDDGLLREIREHLAVERQGEHVGSRGDDGEWR